MIGGTARAIGPIADQVLAWVAHERGPRAQESDFTVHPDDLRRIELVAQAAREAAMFFDLYGMGDLNATSAHLQDER